MKYIAVTYYQGEYEDKEKIIFCLLMVESDVSTEQIDFYVKTNCGAKSSWEIIENVRQLILGTVTMLVSK